MQLIEIGLDHATADVTVRERLAVSSADLPGVLADALPVELPAGSRVGYSHKLLWLNKEGRATIEDLAFEGGRTEAIPMPGHSQRCAIWASAPFGFEEKRLGPPGRGVVVRRCRFSDWYGRGVAFYNQENGAVEDHSRGDDATVEDHGGRGHDDGSREDDDHGGSSGHGSDDSQDDDHGGHGGDD